jgi:insertion element IS1 protein InsB
MIRIESSCIKVSDAYSCPYCKSKNIIKNGTTKTKKQQYHCKNCNQRFIDYYTYKAYNTSLNKNIVLLTKEGLGIRYWASTTNIDYNIA